MWEGFFRNGLHALLAVAGLDEGTAFMLGFVYWVFRELLWWWLVGVLAAIVLRFAWDAPMRSAVWSRAG